MKVLQKRYVHSTLTVVLLGAALTQQAGSQTVYQAPQGEFEGKPVVNIVFQPEQQPLEARELYDLLPVKRNQPYRAVDVRAAIERLYATGRYQDIQVDVSPVEPDPQHGVLVRFITKNSWFIGAVSAQESLAGPPTRGQIVNAARLQLGDPFDPEQMSAAVANIRKLLVNNGYFDPVVEPQLQYDTSYQEVHIIFVVKAGKRGRYFDPPGRPPKRPPAKRC
jgi:outer membrane protein assembly factor BamA